MLQCFHEEEHWVLRTPQNTRLARCLTLVVPLLCHQPTADTASPNETNEVISVLCCRFHFLDTHLGFQQVEFAIGPDRGVTVLALFQVFFVLHFCLVILQRTDVEDARCTRAAGAEKRERAK